MSAREVLHFFCDEPDCFACDLSGGTRKEIEDRCTRNGWLVTRSKHYCPEHAKRTRPPSEPGERLLAELRSIGGSGRVSGVALQTARALERAGLLVHAGERYYRIK